MGKDYPNESEQLTIYKKLLDNTFHVIVNINDAYAPGCADDESIDGDDVEELMPLYKQYGVWLTNLAYVSVKRWCIDNATETEIPYPSVEEIRKPFKINLKEKEIFESAASEIITMANEGKIIFQIYWARRQKEKGKDV